MNFPSINEVLLSLDDALRRHPKAEIFVLSEYTFEGLVPDGVKNLCRDHQRYLVAGGTETASDANYYNTAFVIGPAGEVVFRQVKCVPIQFFKDGLPAPEQNVWDSPWGKSAFASVTI